MIEWSERAKKYTTFVTEIFKGNCKAYNCRTRIYQQIMSYNEL